MDLYFKAEKGGGELYPFRYPATSSTTFIRDRTVTTLSIAANELRGYILDVRGEAQITKITANVSGATAAGNALFGVYTPNPLTGLPQNLLFESDNALPFNTGVAALQTRNLNGISDFTLQKGLFWVLFNADTAVQWSIPLQNSLFQIAFASAANICYYGEANVYTGTMPLTAAGTGTLGSITNHAPLAQFTTI